MVYIEGGRSCLYQWDVDQRLVVEHEGVTEVHFANPVTDPALVCDVYEEGGQRYADIPNPLLQQPYDISAYCCCGECVRLKTTFDLTPRAKPADYVYTETEVKNFDALEKRVEELEEGGGVSGPQGPKGEPGKDGSPGADGITPHIGSNGNWYIGDTDTGKPSRGADGSDGQPGQDGEDGVSPTVTVSKSGKVTTVSITDKNGTKTATINDGSDGAAGSNGKDGASVTVANVSTSSADGGSNVVTFSDGKTLTVKNGSKGSAGTNGTNGSNGVSATHSWSGTTLTVTSASGTSSADLKGAKGDKGDKPVKGTDYFTAADKAEMVAAVIAALPDASEVNY